MPPSKTIPEPWDSFLRELDEKATEETRLDCMGGFVVTQLYGFSRETVDLDVLVIAPKEQLKPLLEFACQGGELHKRHKVYLDYVGVARVPEDYEGRLTEMFPKAYKHLRLCALDRKVVETVEDLIAICKREFGDNWQEAFKETVSVVLGRL